MPEKYLFRNTNNRNGALLILFGLCGVLVWRNRFTIQRRLETIGIKTPLLTGGLEEAARSVAAQVKGKMERGATIAEEIVNRRIA